MNPEDLDPHASSEAQAALLQERAANHKAIEKLHIADRFKLMHTKETETEIQTLRTQLQAAQQAAETLATDIRNLRDQRGRHNTGIAYDRLLKTLETYETKNKPT
jgi:hypothetical protein